MIRVKVYDNEKIPVEIKGSVYIADLSQYATKEYVDSKVGSIALPELPEVASDEIENIVEKHLIQKGLIQADS